MTLEELKDDIDFLCQSSTASYPAAAKLRNLNVAYRDVQRIIWESAGEWEYDDSNAADFPFATTTLVDGQQDYELPSSLQRILRVEVKDSSGNYVLLKQIGLDDIPQATTEFLSGGGTPLYYDVVGRSVLLYPIPATGYVTMSAGLKVYFDRDITALASDADTPGFAVPFHRILSYMAALDYSRDDAEIQRFILRKSELEKGIRAFYAKRNVDKNTSIKRKKTWRQYT
jgi:hypothetical protein